MFSSNAFVMEIKPFYPTVAWLVKSKYRGGGKKAKLTEIKGKKWNWTWHSAQCH